MITAAISRIRQALHSIALPKICSRTHRAQLWCGYIVYSYNTWPTAVQLRQTIIILRKRYIWRHSRYLLSTNPRPIMVLTKSAVVNSRLNSRTPARIASSSHVPTTSTASPHLSHVLPSSAETRPNPTTNLIKRHRSPSKTLQNVERQLLQRPQTATYP